jgi:uncharacterized protein YkwD
MGFSYGHSVRAALIAALGLKGVAHADVLSAVQTLRAGGCGGILPAAAPLARSARLDRAAEQWAQGHTLSGAAAGNGYPAAAGVFVRGPEQGLIERMRRSECHTVMERSFLEVGLYQHGEDRWLVLAAVGTAGAAKPAAAIGAAAPEPPAPRSERLAGSLFAARALELVNEARAHGVRCGGRAYAPAPPLALSGTLDSVALGHAADMAFNDYFEHQDRNGQSPADRVRAVGYHEKLVGENIAYGPKTVEEVVQGWLDSPDHCENIMDPRFAEMGIAQAAGHSTRRGLYWVQVLAEPRA